MQYNATRNRIEILLQLLLRLRLLVLLLVLLLLWSWACVCEQTFATFIFVIMTPEWAISGKWSDC